jgi:N-acetylglucosaminyldiphosphoundecaprenol N-acetyl-beta-D-mannosaminyltransferase
MKMLTELSFTRGDVFLRLADTLEQSGSRYCVVGDTSKYPDYIASDVDFVIDVDSFDDLYALLARFCTALKVLLVQMHQHEHNAWYCSLAWKGPNGNLNLLAVDFCKDFIRGGRLYLSSSSLLDRRIPARSKTPNAGRFYVPSPPDEFIYYLLKRIDKGVLTKAQGDHLSSQWRANPTSAAREVEKYWSANDCRLLTTAAETGNWDPVLGAVGSLRERLHKRTPVSLKGRTRTWLRRFRNILHPSGIGILISGEDAQRRDQFAESIHMTFRPAFHHVDVITPAFRKFDLPGKICGLESPPRADAGGIPAALFLLRQSCSLGLGDLRIRRARASLILLETCHTVLPPWQRNLNPGLWVILNPAKELAPESATEETVQQPSPNLYVTVDPSPQNSLHSFIAEHLADRVYQRCVTRIGGSEPSSLGTCSIPETQSRSLLGIRVDGTSYNEVITHALQWARAAESRYICEAPVHMVMECYDRPEYLRVINGADVITPGGMPLVWALRRMALPAQQRVYGPQMMLQICSAAASEGIPIGLYGATAETLDRLTNRLKEQNPNLKIAYTFAPPFRDLEKAEDAAIIDAINSSGCRILFVGLGCPKQETWMASHKGKVRSIMFGVGAAFDFISGVKRQAPAVMQTLGTEWLFRLLCEPGRLWFRYLYHNPRFLFLLACQFLGKRNQIDVPTSSGFRRT